MNGYLLLLLKGMNMTVWQDLNRPQIVKTVRGVKMTLKECKYCGEMKEVRDMELYNMETHWSLPNRVVFICNECVNKNPARFGKE